MADKHTPIPQRTPVVDRQGIITRYWNEFFYKIFGTVFKRLDELEAAKNDHETRITTLEP